MTETSWVECPNHEGNFDCTPFCALCEGEQEYQPAPVDTGPVTVDHTPREGFTLSAMVNGHRVTGRYIDWDVPNAVDHFICEHNLTN